jgi:hypothetical protein
MRGETAQQHASNGESITQETLPVASDGGRSGRTRTLGRLLGRGSSSSGPRGHSSIPLRITTATQVPEQGDRVQRNTLASPMEQHPTSNYTLHRGNVDSGLNPQPLRQNIDLSRTSASVVDEPALIALPPFEPRATRDSTRTQQLDQRETLLRERELRLEEREVSLSQRERAIASREEHVDVLMRTAEKHRDEIRNLIEKQSKEAGSRYRGN